MADSARPAAPDSSGRPARDDQPGPDAEPPTGGLAAVLDKLRDAAAAHDDEIDGPADPPGLRGAQSPPGAGAGTPVIRSRR
jgi:hypothetical protein